jgi:hypothetical protein
MQTQTQDQTPLCVLKTVGDSDDTAQTTGTVVCWPAQAKIRTFLSGFPCFPLSLLYFSQLKNSLAGA